MPPHTPHEALVPDKFGLGATHDEIVFVQDN